MGFLGGGNFGFGGGSGSSTTDFWTKWQKQIGNQLGDWLLGMFGGDWMDQYAQPSKLEKGAMNMAEDYFKGGLPDAYKNAQDALNRAMTSDYADIIDPTQTEKLYGAIEKQTMEDILPKVLRNASGVANIGGMLNSGAGAKLQLEEMGRVTNELSKNLQNLRYGDELQRRDIAMDRERRQLQAVPLAESVGNLPLSFASNAMQWGGMPRQFQGMQINNPLTKALFQALGLRGQQTTDSDSSSWRAGGKGVIGLPW